MAARTDLTIGSIADAVIRVDTSHDRLAEIVVRYGLWYLHETTGSAASTRINGNPVSGWSFAPLEVGDVITFRGSAVRVEVEYIDGSLERAERLRFRFGAATAAGDHGANEDASLASPVLVAVADGVGGHPRGADASAAAVEAVRNGDPAAPLDDLIGRARDGVAELATPADRRSGRAPATTLDIVRIVNVAGAPPLLEIAHVGDGAVFIQTPDTRAQLVTTEHGHENSLDRGIGLQDQRHDYLPVDGRVGQRVILTSDGLLKALGADTVDHLLNELRRTPPRQTADQLVLAAVDLLRSEAGAGHVLDDVTVVVADVVLDAPLQPAAPIERVHSR
ncbi:protein phosphatase 2C domain-containing protein [uncultured Jatrophihabitans sp.]|uniref:protein phosphatase 2C domain-containing protein n=1 Tax=uncultured Jatrophihabitans sp. TaxID=1610747 RepID=UPI0035CC0A83